ncbi:MarR family transcriptional regulator [Clostridium perfringens]|uniref:Transcriptional regulator, MarR family n=1 Tax=Clostridium perfringens D str. JGS1721 TaxID=488537 RepID=B1V684_CLOPF|nr:MarR family transcriptional regulator [Clostridium perfringens]EDT70683.1 transcriptional regulator, MarR family [Clostridium perfringens D str. JGS1721]PWX09919.1 MarR family transcriptional regulator [Clostridium perfringens]
MDKYNILKLENQLCFRLYASSREVIKKYKPILDQYNLTYTQYLTMLVLWENEKITVKGIGKKLHLDSGTLTPLIKKLEKMNLVTKYRSKEDDRVVIVELTDEGRNLKDDMIDVPRKAFCSLGIEKEQILELKKNLDSLLEILK